MVVIHKKKIETAEEKEARKHQEQGQALGIQDEYQAKGFELVSWVQDHKGVVLGLILVAIAGGVALSGYVYYQQRVSEQASSAYLEAVHGLANLPRTGEENSQKLQEAQKQLVELAKNHKRAGVAVLANLYAGHLALENKDSADAVELYKNALQKIGPKDELYPLVLIGLGYAEERNGQAGDALTRFAAVADLKDNVGKDLALWEAARLANDAKETERAKGYVARLLEEFPASIYEKDAKRLNESL